jgi:flagellar protein FliS
LAEKYTETQSIAEKGRHIGDAISLIEGLQVSLNHKSDQRMASNFDALYDYMKRRLLEANVRNDAAILREVSGLMHELKSAWDAIA